MTLKTRKEGHATIFGVVLADQKHLFDSLELSSSIGFGVRNERPAPTNRAKLKPLSVPGRAYHDLDQPSRHIIIHLPQIDSVEGPSANSSATGKGEKSNHGYTNTVQARLKPERIEQPIATCQVVEFEDGNINTLKEDNGGEPQMQQQSTKPPVRKSIQRDKVVSEKRKIPAVEMSMPSPHPGDHAQGNITANKPRAPAFLAKLQNQARMPYMYVPLTGMPAVCKVKPGKTRLENITNIHDDSKKTGEIGQAIFNFSIKKDKRKTSTETDELNLSRKNYATGLERGNTKNPITIIVSHDDVVHHETEPPSLLPDKGEATKFSLPEISLTFPSFTNYLHQQTTPDLKDEYVLPEILQDTKPPKTLAERKLQERFQQTLHLFRKTKRRIRDLDKKAASLLSDKINLSTRHLHTPNSQVHAPNSHLPTPSSQVHTPHNLLHTPNSQVHTPNTHTYTPDSYIHLPHSHMSPAHTELRACTPSSLVISHADPESENRQTINAAEICSSDLPEPRERLTEELEIKNVNKSDQSAEQREDNPKSPKYLTKIDEQEIKSARHAVRTSKKPNIGPHNIITTSSVIASKSSQLKMFRDSDYEQFRHTKFHRDLRNRNTTASVDSYSQDSKLLYLNVKIGYQSSHLEDHDDSINNRLTPEMYS